MTTPPLKRSRHSTAKPAAAASKSSDYRHCPYAYQECRLECGCAPFPNGTFGRSKGSVHRKALKCAHKGESLPERAYGVTQGGPFPTTGLNEIEAHP